jgi:hypothetical protein
MPRTLGARNISPWDHECLIRDYVVGEKSTAEIAAEYGYAEQTIKAHRAEHKAEIAAVTAGMVDEFSHIWSTRKENRLRLLTCRLEEIEDQIAALFDHARAETETIRNIDPDASEVPVNGREYRDYVKEQRALVREIADQTGQLPQRKSTIELDVGEAVPPPVGTRWGPISDVEPTHP